LKFFKPPVGGLGVKKVEKMKHYSKYIILLLIISGISQLQGYTQDSLSYYLEQAALNNPGVKARYLEYSAALEKIPQESSLPDPEMQFGYFLKPMELLGGNQIANISLMQMFPWFGTLKAAKDESSKMAMAKFENFRDARNELYYNVKSSYYRVYRTKKELEISETNLDILHSLEQLALVKFRSGVISASSGTVNPKPSGSNVSSMGSSGTSGSGMSMANGSVSSSSNVSGMASSGGGMSGSMGGGGKNDMVNLLGVQIEIKSLENKIALLKDQLITDKISINRFLNRTPESEIFIDNSLMEVIVPPDILSLSDSLINNPMVKMYQAESGASAAKLDMVTSMGYPMLGLGMNYMVIKKREGNASMMNGNDMIMPMATVSIPIYRKKYRAMRNEAEFMRDAAILLAENTTNNLRVNFQEIMQNLDDATRRVKLYTDQTLLAEKSINLLIASFSSGDADFVEVLRMQQQLIDYQFKQVEAVVDKNSSIAQLVYLTGNK
jgi:outer membrane protein TolC